MFTEAYLIYCAWTALALWTAALGVWMIGLIICLVVDLLDPRADLDRKYFSNRKG